MGLSPYGSSVQHLGGGAFAYDPQAFNNQAAQRDLNALAAYNRGMQNYWPDLSGARIRVITPPAPPEQPFECDYSLSRKTADYCKWGMRA